ncbi:MAG TPA: hypothetical protein ENH99_01040 [Candidatus Pacearchaeota archaeon]|nr:hypothetical protein [Candidatus Pacearchaeota archaeon]
MRKTIIFISIILIISAGTFSVLALEPKNYVRSVTHNHSWTKAICTENNLCQDYEIFCENQNLIRMSPITGASVQFSENWEDPRDEEIREKFC